MIPPVIFQEAAPISEIPRGLTLVALSQMAKDAGWHVLEEKLGRKLLRTKFSRNRVEIEVVCSLKGEFVRAFITENDGSVKMVSGNGKIAQLARKLL